MSTPEPHTSPDVAIELNDVWVQYAIRNAHHYNLKRTATNALTRRREDTDTITALKSITLSIPKGARLGLTGPNGSGKTTLLAVMAGILTPTTGTTKVKGRVLALLGGPAEGLDPEQTGRENVISLGVRLNESVDAMHSRMDEIKEFSGLGKRFDHPVYTYSSGMQARLRFTTVTSIDTNILLVDEGIGAADAEFNERAAERLTHFYQNSSTLLLASHHEELVKRYCDATLQIKSGKIHC